MINVINKRRQKRARFRRKKKNKNIRNVHVKGSGSQKKPSEFFFVNNLVAGRQMLI